MPNKTSNTRTDQVYEFDTTHADFLTTMNSAQVLLAGGNIPASQDFQIILRKSNGTEIYLKDMVDGDTLVLRFTRVVQAGASVDYNSIVVTT